MKIFKLLTTSVAISSSSMPHLKTTDFGKVISNTRNNPVVCDENKKCPKDSFCLKIHGESGYCILRMAST